MAKDCFFYMDMEQDVPDEEKKISVLCIDCREKNYPNVGWFWEGTKLGYGPWVYKCNSCNHVVHSPDQEENEKVTTTNKDS